MMVLVANGLSMISFFPGNKNSSIKPKLSPPDAIPIRLNGIVPLEPLSSVFVTEAYSAIVGLSRIPYLKVLSTLDSPKPKKNPCRLVLELQMDEVRQKTYRNEKPYATEVFHMLNRHLRWLP